MSRQSDSANLIRFARNFLLERETRLVNARRNALDSRNSIVSSTSTESLEPFQRNGNKRRSFTSSLTNMFGRRPSQIETNLPMVATQEDLSQTFVHPNFSEAQHIALCAVLLDEWVKELAALAQEHTIAQLAALFK